MVPYPRTHNGIMHDTVDDLVMEVFEQMPVIFEVERLWQAREGGQGLHNDEVVDVGC